MQKDYIINCPNCGEMIRKISEHVDDGQEFKEYCKACKRKVIAVAEVVFEYYCNYEKEKSK